LVAEAIAATRLGATTIAIVLAGGGAPFTRQPSELTSGARTSQIGRAQLVSGARSWQVERPREDTGIRVYLR
jgi:hypothetical protein